MSTVDNLLRDVCLPPMIRVRQIFKDDALEDISGSIRAQMAAPGIASRIRRGARIAVGVGSRGMAELPLLVATVVDELRRQGANPFVVPAMGSHGGATAEGQLAVLEALGVTEASAGCPILSSMETVELGKLPNGLAVLMDKHAMQADGIVVINRVKAHTSFSGPSESGLVKMLTIGLGKQKGADACHSYGFGEMARNIVDMAHVKLARAPILFGVGTIENAYENISRVAVVPAEDIVERDRELLKESKAKMPSILFNPIDVLIVDCMGKDYSGTGTDPNITGRAATPYVSVNQKIAKMAILDLSARSKGNATGMGFADVCTRRLFNKVDLDATYANHITSTVLAHARIPVIMETDERAVQLAVKTSNVPDLSRLRMVRIPNTLHLEQIRISEGLLNEAREHPQIEILGGPEPWVFDEQRNLVGLRDDTATTHPS